MDNYKERYEKLCDDIKQQSIDLRRAFNTDDCTSGAVRTTTGIYDRIVDKSYESAFCKNPRASTIQEHPRCKAP